MRGTCGGLRAGCGKPPSLIPIIDSGTFRERITIQVPSLSPDGRGGGVYGWSEVATVWARIQTRGAVIFGNREIFEEAQMRARTEYLITIRYGLTLTTAMRVIYKGLDLEIVSIENKDVVNWMVQLLCREEGTGAP